MQWLCSQLCYVTAANHGKPMNKCRDWAFSSSGLEVGLPALQLPMFAECDSLPKGDLWDLFVFRNPFLLWKLSPPLPTRSLRSLRAAVPSASSALHYACIMPIPSLQLQKTVEKASLMQRSRGFGHGVVVSKICYNAVIVLSVVLCDCCKPMNSCWDWAFSNSGLEVGLPALQLPMLQNVTQCQTRFGRHVCLRNQCLLT